MRHEDLTPENQRKANIRQIVTAMIGSAFMLLAMLFAYIEHIIPGYGWAVLECIVGLLCFASFIAGCVVLVTLSMVLYERLTGKDINL